MRGSVGLAGPTAIEVAKSLTPEEQSQLMAVAEAVGACCPGAAAHQDCDGCAPGTAGFDNCVNKVRVSTQRVRDLLRQMASEERATYPHMTDFMIAVVDAAEGKSSSKTWLYVLLGVGAVALVGGGVYLATRKRAPAVAHANRRRRGRRRRRA